MTFSDRIDQINLLILNHQLSEADEALGFLAPETLTEKRIHAHFKAICTFRRGEIIRAKSQMEAAITQFGENVNVLRDLLVCQYHLQDMMGFRANLTKLETVLNLVLDGEREKAPTTDELFFNVCAASPFFPKSPQFKHMASRLKDVYQLIGGLAQIPSPEEACPRLKALKRKFVHMSGETTEALSNPIRTALLQHSEADFAKSMLAILEILDVTWYHAKHMFSHASVSDPTSSLFFCHPVVYVSKQS